MGRKGGGGMERVQGEMRRWNEEGGRVGRCRRKGGDKRGRPA